MTGQIPISELLSRGLITPEQADELAGTISDDASVTISTEALDALKAENEALKARVLKGTVIDQAQRNDTRARLCVPDSIGGHRGIHPATGFDLRVVYDPTSDTYVAWVPVRLWPMAVLPQDPSKRFWTALHRGPDGEITSVQRPNLIIGETRIRESLASCPITNSDGSKVLVSITGFCRLQANYRKPSEISDVLTRREVRDNWFQASLEDDDPEAGAFIPSAQPETRESRPDITGSPNDLELDPDSPPEL